MPQTTLETRIAALERQVAAIQRQLDGKRNWLDEVKGSFKDDPEFEEIIRLGREIRQADRT